MSSAHNSNENFVQTCRTNSSGYQKTSANNVNSSDQSYSNVEQNLLYDDESLKKGELQRGLSILNSEEPQSAPIQGLQSSTFDKNRQPGISLLDVQSASLTGTSTRNRINNSCDAHLIPRGMSDDNLNNNNSYMPPQPGASIMILNSDSSYFPLTQPGASIMVLNSDSSHVPLTQPGASIMNLNREPSYISSKPGASVISLNSDASSVLPSQPGVSIMDFNNYASSIQPLQPGVSIVHDSHSPAVLPFQSASGMAEIENAIPVSDEKVEDRTKNKRKICYIF